ncbi:Transcription factor FAMA [Bienertia sinuspersici]
MQKEENYSASNTEVAGIFVADVDNSSSPTNDSSAYYHHHHHDNGPFSSYHDCEVYSNNHTNTTMSHNHANATSVMVDYMLNTPTTNAVNNMISTRSGSSYHQEQQQNYVDHQQSNMSSMNCVSAGNIPINNVDRTLSFADVMQFADFGPKLALTHPQSFQQHQQNENMNAANHNRDSSITGIEDDPAYFLKFPVLSNSHMMSGHRNNSHTIHDNEDNSTTNRNGGFVDHIEEIKARENQEEDAAAAAYNNPVQLEFLGNAYVGNSHEENLMSLGTNEKMEAHVNMEGGVTAATAAVGNNNKSSSSSSKRKRPRTVKTNEEVESQRMTHIAVERNRRKQMNEHLRVLRSLMPSSYVQRGDQASIIGGAIEFVRELEQLLQCLESQKRRRLYGDQQVPAQARPIGDPSSNSTLGLVQQTPQPQIGFPPPPILANNQYSHQDEDHHQLDHTAMPAPAAAAAAAAGLLQEETAESKSFIADVEVKVLGFDALIKILSRRRQGQLIKIIAALEDLQFTILHTNITTIEQTVLYSFNVKVASETRFTAEDIAGSVQQIFTFIHANTNVI